MRLVAIFTGKVVGNEHTVDRQLNLAGRRDSSPVRDSEAIVPHGRLYALLPSW